MADRAAQLCEIAIVQSIYCGAHEFQMHTPTLAEQLQTALDDADEDALAAHCNERLRYTVCVGMGEGEATTATIEIECEIPAEFVRHHAAAAPLCTAEPNSL